MVDDNVGNTSDRPEAGRLPLSLALLPLRDTVLFPQSILPLAAGRAASLKLIEEAARGDRTIGVITQRDPAAEEPGEADLHRIGTVATIHKVVKQPDGTLRLVVQGLRRFRILELTQTRPYLLARVEEMDEVAADAAISRPRRSSAMPRRCSDRSSSCLRCCPTSSRGRSRTSRSRAGSPT